MDKQDRISPRTGKPVREYVHHITDKQLAEANRLRSEAQKKLLSDSTFRQARADKQTEIYYADPEKQQRKRIANGKTQRDPERRKAQAKTTSKSWTIEETRAKRIKGIQEANQRPDVKKQRKDHGKHLKDLLADPIRGPEMISKRLAGRKKNAQESNLEVILKLLKFPYRFTGCGQYMIKTYNPDFVRNTNDAIIEVYGEYHHNLPPNIDHDKLRMKAFEEKGYDVLIIWSKELKDLRKIVLKLIAFEKEYKSRRNCL